MHREIILGPPGCAKTTFLLNTAEEALNQGVSPRSIGFISFTKKAAEEGRDRAAKRFGIDPENFPYFKTIHALGFKHLGLRRDRMVSWTHLKELGKFLGIDFKGKEVQDDDVYGMNGADRMLFLEGLARSTKKPLKLVWEEAFEDSIDWFELDRFSRAYSQFKRSRGLLDFTDILEKYSESSLSELPKLDLLLVDEAQDLSPLQWDVVDKLSENAGHTYVCGDDCQGCYRWSGADTDRFITMSGYQRTLNVSYRIPSSVHRVADSISDRIQKKRPRNWKPRDVQGSVNYFSSYEDVDMSSDSWLLMARNGYLLNRLEDWCMDQGLSFHSVNRDPLKSKSLAAIRVWENLRRGNEESAERVLEVVKFIDPRAVTDKFVLGLKSSDPGRLFDMGELQSMGLNATSIWHESLTRISPKERDYYIAARRRGEALLKEPRIKISTIHSAKGGEADHVLLLSDMSFRCFKNMEINPDDELRVWYVGATRSRETLNIVVPSTDLHFEI